VPVPCTNSSEYAGGRATTSRQAPVDLGGRDTVAHRRSGPASCAASTTACTPRQLRREVTCTARAGWSGSCPSSNRQLSPRNRPQTTPPCRSLAQKGDGPARQRSAPLPRSSRSSLLGPQPPHLGVKAEGHLASVGLFLQHRPDRRKARRRRWRQAARYGHLGRRPCAPGPSTRPLVGNQLDVLGPTLRPTCERVPTDVLAL